MAIRGKQIAYIAKTKTTYKPLGAAHHFSEVKPKVPFLWGDMVYVIATSGDTATISAKGHHLDVPIEDLTEDPVLCLWQIDCGQGDAALLRFPNGKTMLIDAGPGPLMANTPALATNFLQWMRFVDQSWRDEFEFASGGFDLDSVVISHPDYDHFGGLLDFLPSIGPERFRLGTVYHNGLARFDGTATKFESGSGFSQLGPVRGTDPPDLFLTTLLDGFSDVRKYSRATGGRSWRLTGTYGDLLSGLAELEGHGVKGLMRVHERMGELPEFDAGEARVRLLGPVEEPYKKRPAMRYLDGVSASSMKSPSLTRNGVSVVLRIDYRGFRLLMTGDLNFRSQAVLLNNVPSIEFKCHVAKACHHGSEDVSKTFLRAMAPKATLFSSGDNESHAHPRAKVLGMAGAFSIPTAEPRVIEFLGLEEQKHEAPLIYSTELSRSTQLYKPGRLIKDGRRIRGATLGSTAAQGRKGPQKALSDWLLADGLVYGLINVRTDGERVVIGVMKEDQRRPGFQTEEFTA